MKSLKILAASMAAFLSGCSSIKVQDYENQKPVLKLEDYLNGEVEAHGFFQDRSGLIVKRFTVKMDCKWTENTGIIDESFTYTDGSTSKRIWTLTRDGAGNFFGTANDVIGEAKGETSGNAFHWNYTLKLPVGNSTYNVQFDDWMFLMNEEVMINKAKMSKFGIYLGEVTLTFFKRKK